MRVTYWATTSLEPGIEAVSKEVFDLANRFQPSRVFSINPHLRLRVAGRGRVLGFHPAWDPLLRPLIRRLEPWADISHVYGEVSPWIYHRTLGKRPIVLTVASEKGEPVAGFLARCRVIVVQTSGMQERLAGFATDGTRVQLVYPGVDLAAFRSSAQARALTRPRVLLATFPRAAGELTVRGVDFLLDAAAALPEVDFILLSRPWRSGESAAAVVRQTILSRDLRNVRLLDGVQTDMPAVYESVDLTVIPYATPEGGKECPRSLVESMASGVPVLISTVAPFSRFVEAQGCGATFALQPTAFGAALERVLSRYREISTRAAQCARENFDVQSTFRRYHDIYSSLT